MQRRHERPLRRVNPSGKTVWVARYTGRDGKRRSAGTFDLKREAQDAIDAAYDRVYATRKDTVGGYADSWTERLPRSQRTNHSYNQRLGYVLDVQLEGVPLRDWPLHDLGRRQARDLVDVLLVKQGRSAGGAAGVVRVLSAMWSDALEDEMVTGNPFARLRVRANDPRIRKPARRPQVFTWEQMHGFARSAATASDGTDRLVKWRRVYAESMVRVFSDCGPRLGEVLPLRRSDLKLGAACDEPGCPMRAPHLHFRATAHEGAIQSGTKTDHGEASPGRVTPLTTGLEALLRALPARIDTTLLFPSQRGCVWRERNFYRDVWYPARAEAGISPTCHDFRHSANSLYRAQGLDPADLSTWLGHSLETATRHYTHSMGLSIDQLRGTG